MLSIMLCVDWREPVKAHTKWKSSKPEGKWKDISAEIDVLGSALNGKSNTWTKKALKENQNFTRW